MEVHRNRLPLAIVVGVVAAGAATLILRPRDGLIQPAAVEPTAYFSAEELDRARDYRGPQRALGLAELGLSAATLALLAIRPPGRVRALLARAARRPLLGGAAVGAGLSLVLIAVNLPISAVSHARSVDVGLSTQGWLDWMGDLGKSAGIGAVLSAGGAAIALLLIRRFPRRWWAPASAAVVSLSAVFVFLGPVVLDPIFNRFEPLPEGRLRTEVLDLARRSGVDVGEVFRIDASRRTTGANAYVGGLGQTKRVVLYDNLIEDFPPEQLRSVVAHELAHVKHRDLWRGLLWLALVAPGGTLVAQRLAERFAAREPGGPVPGLPAALPALALALAIVSFGVGLAGNVVSRRVEARADAFALDITRDPAAHIGLERRLSVQNVSDPDPPELLHLVFGTHPKTVERIGYGLAWARGR